MVTNLLGKPFMYASPVTNPLNLYRHHVDFTGQQGEIRFEADLDHKAGQPAPAARQGDAKNSNKFRVVIKKTAVLQLSVLQSYLNGQTSLSENVIDAITFLDHLLRETPSHNQEIIPLRRSFFDRRTNQRAGLGFGVEAMKGVYQSIRAAHGGQMVVNVDVSNAVFWNESSIMNLAREVTKANSMQDLVQKLQPVKLRHDAGFQPSNGMIQVRKLKKNDFYVRHKERNEYECE
jgi:eukaryotic translation initiation factor 2C